MANVTDVEQLVIKSKGHIVHKREFDFAFNSHSGIFVTLLTGTRAYKNRNMIHALGPKRTIMSSSEEELKENLVVETDTENHGDDVVKKMKKKNTKNKTLTRGRKSKVGSSENKKFPKFLKELLNSGTIEGLNVKYIRGKTVLSYLICCIFFFLILQYDLGYVWQHDRLGTSFASTTTLQPLYPLKL